MTEKENVEYLENFDHERFGKLHPHRIIPSRLNRAAVFANVNRNVYYAMGPDKAGSSEALAARPESYRHLLTEILKIPGLRFLTALELSTAELSDGEILCQIRHDVDADIVAALHLARIERDLGISATYYLLHTASYYGTWHSPDKKGTATFERNECMIDVYLELQQLGHEVALHTDPLMLYQTHNVDGAAAMTSEIEWLRSMGLAISGTAPHNSPSVYGAGNSAIFKGRALSPLKLAGPKGVVFNGKWAPLGILDEANLGLLYEADEVYEKEWNVDFISIIENNKWWRHFRTPYLRRKLINIRAKNKYFDGISHVMEIMPDIYPDTSSFWLNNIQILHGITQRAPKCAILSVHPVYYGYRTSPTQEPEDN